MLCYALFRVCVVLCRVLTVTLETSVNTVPPEPTETRYMVILKQNPSAI